MGSLVTDVITERAYRDGTLTSGFAGEGIAVLGLDLGQQASSSLLVEVKYLLVANTRVLGGERGVVPGTCHIGRACTACGEGGAPAYQQQPSVRVSATVRGPARRCELDDQLLRS